MIDSQFETIIENYLIEVKGSLTDNWIAAKIRNDLPKLIQKEARINENYLVKGSPGITNWAEIPWIGIFDKDITITATKGYYIVYLFSSDMSGFYISLNQGWTQYKNRYGTREGRLQIQQNSLKFRDILKTPFKDFTFDPINLKATGDLGKGYQLGHVCGKFYPRINIPDDMVLINDLRNLISEYNRAKSIVGTELFDFDYLYNDEDNDNEPSEAERIDVNKEIGSAETLDEIELRLQKIEEKYANTEPKLRARIAKAISRNTRAARLIKIRDNYICHFCGELGFEKENGERYAEVHHKQELAKSGLDIPSNMICICPRCHRILHYGSSSEIDKLKRQS